LIVTVNNFFPEIVLKSWVILILSRILLLNDLVLSRRITELKTNDINNNKIRILDGEIPGRFLYLNTI